MYIDTWTFRLPYMCPCRACSKRCHQLPLLWYRIPTCTLLSLSSPLLYHTSATRDDLRQPRNGRHRDRPGTRPSLLLLPPPPPPPPPPPLRDRRPGQLTAAARHRLLQGTAHDDDGYETASSYGCSIESLKSSLNEYMLENGTLPPPEHGIFWPPATVT